VLTFYPSRIQGSKRHRIPDPGPGSATLVDTMYARILSPSFLLSQDITVDSFAIRILRTEELGAGNTIQVSYGTVRYGTSLYVSVRFTFLDVGNIAGI
jgi:hypothetical protein